MSYIQQKPQQYFSPSKNSFLFLYDAILLGSFLVSMSCSKKQLHIKIALLEPLDKKDFHCHHLTQKLIRICLITAALVLHKKPLNAILYIHSSTLPRVTGCNIITGKETLHAKYLNTKLYRCQLPYIDVWSLPMFVFESLF